MRVNKYTALGPSILTPRVIFRFIINEVSVKIFVNCNIMSYIVWNRLCTFFFFVNESYRKISLRIDNVNQSINRMLT